jgi:cell division protein FtsQ
MVHFSWRIISSLLVALMSLSIYLLLFTATFQADVLEVEGMQRLTMSDLGLVLDVTGEPIVSLDPAQIRRDLLQAFPDIQEARVWVNLPASVRLEISERLPVISWEREGETVWVDQDGVVFSQRGEFTDPLLTVRGEALPLINPLEQVEVAENAPATAERLDPKMIQVLQAMSQYMPGGAAMVYDPEHGFGWDDERGWQVYFGRRLEDIETKLVIYQAIIDRMQAEGVQPALISMEFLYAPYYRMER